MAVLLVSMVNRASMLPVRMRRTVTSLCSHFTNEMLMQCYFTYPLYSLT